MTKTRRYAKRIWLDALPERLREEVLQDRIEPREDEVFGLTPARWSQVSLLFAGARGQDVLYCLSRGLNTYATALYLGVSERTVRNVAAGFLNKLRAIHGGTGGLQIQMFETPELNDEFAPARRPPTRRGRPRRTATVEAQAEQAEAVEVEMCY